MSKNRFLLKFFDSLLSNIGQDSLEKLFEVYIPFTLVSMFLKYSRCHIAMHSGVEIKRVDISYDEHCAGTFSNMKQQNKYYYCMIMMIYIYSFDIYSNLFKFTTSLCRISTYIESRHNVGVPEWTVPEWTKA